MIEIIAILGLLLALGGVGIYFHRQTKKAGQNAERIKHVQNANEGLKDENEDLADRPRTLSDRIKRLQRWRDKLPKN